MVVYKLLLSTYRLVDETERRFQHKTLYLRCLGTQGEDGDNLNQTRSEKSDVAASKPGILISQLLDKIVTTFGRLHLHF